jgi:hypothetical protein
MNLKVSHAFLLVMTLAAVSAYGLASSELKASVGQPGVPSIIPGFKIVDYSYKRPLRARFFVIYDGVPEYKRKRIINLIDDLDSTSVDSAFVI